MKRQDIPVGQMRGIPIGLDVSRFLIFAQQFIGVWYADHLRRVGAAWRRCCPAPGRGR
jgi:hypothetical protein